MLSFVAYLIAAILFACAALGADIGHAVEWGLCAVAVGLAISTAPRINVGP